MRQNRTKKLRKSVSESVVTLTEYEQRLRNQFESTNA